MVSGFRPFVVAFWTTLFGLGLVCVLMLANRGLLPAAWRQDVAPPPLAIDVDATSRHVAQSDAGAIDFSDVALRTSRDPYPELTPAPVDVAFPGSRDLPETAPDGEFEEFMAAATPPDGRDATTDDFAEYAPQLPSASSMELLQLQDDVVSLRREIERLAEAHLGEQMQALERKQEELRVLQNDGVLQHLMELMETMNQQQSRLAEAEGRRLALAEAAPSEPAPVPLPAMLSAGTPEQPISLRIEIAEMSDVLSRLESLAEKAFESRTSVSMPVSTDNPAQAVTISSNLPKTRVEAPAASHPLLSRQNVCLCCHRVRSQTASGSSMPAMASPLR